MAALVDVHNRFRQEVDTDVRAPTLLCEATMALEIASRKPSQDATKVQIAAVRSAVFKGGGIHAAVQTCIQAPKLLSHSTNTAALLSTLLEANARKHQKALSCIWVYHSAFVLAKNIFSLSD